MSKSKQFLQQNLFEEGLKYFGIKNRNIAIEQANIWYDDKNSWQTKRWIQAEIFGDHKGKILDMACGSGVFVFSGLHKGYDVYGIEIAEQPYLYSKNGKTTSCAEYGIDFKAIFDKVGPRPSDDCHLDHIIPMSLFNFDIKEHVQLCNCPENLRWVHWEENLEKADKIIETIILNEPKLIEICEILNIKFSDKYS